MLAGAAAATMHPIGGVKVRRSTAHYTCLPDEELYATEEELPFSFILVGQFHSGTL